MLRWIGTCLAIVGSAFLLLAGLARAAEDDGGVTRALEPVLPYDLAVDVRDLPWVPVTEKVPLGLPVPQSTKHGRSLAPEPANIPLAPMPAPIQNFAGMSLTDSCTGGACGSGFPPDINGDVGPNHYIEAVNASYAIYSKTGTRLAAFTENSLWSGVGSSPCNGNSRGDPVVIYDRLADRWILTHFAFSFSGGSPVSPFFQCIAASKTSDPVSGGWWMYAVRMDPGGAGLPAVGQLNDYGKFGVWHDCLYMATNQFQFPAESYAGVAFASFSRSDLYSGAALTSSIGTFDSTVDAFSMVPSHLNGSVPAGTPNYFVNESEVAFSWIVRKFTAGPNCGAGGSLGSPTTVSQASYPGSFPPAPQPNTSRTLDSLADRVMQKVQYRKLGSAESIWVTHTVDSGALLALQWAQIGVTGGSIATTPVQQQIYAPDSVLGRWMPSLAVDKDGNMAVGYSTSNGSSPNFPSIAYSGRLATDPLGNLSQTETQLIAGAGSQVNNCGGGPCSRWGDYTAMSIDPSDDCTFWYTNQYYSSQANGNTGNWQTRIGSFKFPSCGASGPTPVPVNWTNPVGVSVSANGQAANSVTKTGSSLLWNAGAASVQAISSGDGYVEFTTAEKNAAKVCGLGNGDVNQNKNDVEFGFDLTKRGKVRIRLGRSLVTNPNSGTKIWGSYLAGDVFRVAVELARVKFYKNGGLIFTTSGAPSYPLRVDSSFFTPGGTINGAKILAP